MLDDLSKNQKILLGAVVAVVVLIGLVLVVIVGAALIGAFALGVGGSASASGSVATAPQANYDFARTADGVTITHDGGDSIPASELFVVVDGEATPLTAYQGFSAGDRFSTGDRITVSDVSSGSEIRLRWESSDSDEAAVLTVYTVS